VPDADPGYVWMDWVTMGQILSAPMIIAGAIMLGMAYSMHAKKEAAA
jgi:phosphatidylglycerol:prolipoprotein diacylglycerol transferase